MRIIAFIADGAEVRKILEHIGIDARRPRITPTRRPPLSDECDAQVQEGVDVEPEWDPSAQESHWTTRSISASTGELCLGW